MLFIFVIGNYLLRLSSSLSPSKDIVYIFISNYLLWLVTVTARAERLFILGL